MTAATGLMPVGRRQPHIAGSQIFVASVGVVLSLAVALGVGPSSLDGEARRTLAITVLGLGMWGAFPQRAFWPSVLVIALVLVSRTIASPATIAGQVIQLYGTSGFGRRSPGSCWRTPWRSAAWDGGWRSPSFDGMGRRPSLAVLAVGIASLLIAPLSPSTTAKAFLLLPICVGLVEAYGAKRGS